MKGDTELANKGKCVHMYTLSIFWAMAIMVT